MQIDVSVISENLARTYGSLEAVVNVERGRRYSFAEYHKLTNRIVNMMRERLGLRRADTWIGILDNDSVSLLGFFTALKGEARACYTNGTDGLEDQARQIDFVKPKVAFIEARLLPTHYRMLTERGLTIVSMDPAPAEFPGVLHFWDLLDGISDRNPNVVHDDRNDCMVLRFTGGTTGASKAVMYSVDNWLANKDLHNATADPILVPGFRMLHFGALSHASGMVFLPVLFKGGCTITMNDRSLATWCRTVEAEKVGGTLLVPSMLYRLLESDEARAADLSSLKAIYYGASPISPTKLKELRARFGDIFVQLYASSEHPAAATSLSIADHAARADGSERHLMSAGRIVPGMELQVRDSDGRPVPPGREGEIWLKSRATAMGYLHNPEKTAEEFCDGFWKSGDVGRIDEDGFVYVIDRMKDTIVCSGVNVYPTQVEAAIMAHPKVSMAAVVGIPDCACGESVHAEVLARPGTSLDADELRTFVQRIIDERLSSACMPTTFAIASQLPLSPVGKVLRRVVRDACRQRSQPDAANAA
jgi:fatty-acyl-CoA synthase